MEGSVVAIAGRPDAVVVGAGAAGLATAIFTRRLNPRLSVVVLEGARRPGAKILVSGGSRCNVTNAKVSEADFWGGRRSIVRRVLRSLPVVDTVRFFQELGVSLHEEPDGKLFPDSNRARDVLDALVAEVHRCGAILLPGCRVTAIARSPDGFVVSTASGDVQARSVVLATGGRSLPKSGSDGAGYSFASALGHHIVDPTPALVPLVLDESSPHRLLSGISHAAEIAIWVDRAVRIRLNGSLLWTHFGVSGPVALNASRHWERARIEGRKVAATMAFLPGQRFEAVDARLALLAGQRPRASARAGVATMVPDAVAGVMLDRAGIDAAGRLGQLTRAQRRSLAHALTEWPLPVIGTRGYNYAEVTAGGVSLDEVEPATLQSRICPGLYFAGEILDVDGRLGGFNFQWAWASARAAAQGVAAAGR